MPLSDILHMQIHQELSSTGDDISIISVRRKHLWDDTMTQFLKRSFDPRKPTRVIFHGEEAFDGGGPCREYFRLLCSSIRERSSVFFTNDDVINFRPNVALFRECRFHLVGLMVGMSILHGGPGFPFLPRVIYDYIARDKMAVDSNAGDVANPSTRHIINLACLCASAPHFRHFLKPIEI